MRRDGEHGGSSRLEKLSQEVGAGSDGRNTLGSQLDRLYLQCSQQTVFWPKRLLPLHPQSRPMGKFILNV